MAQKQQQLKRYTVRGAGGTREVMAVDERNARHLAMVDRWGAPTGMYGWEYEGRGLSVTEEK